jgi:hypothetical protein
MILFQWNFRKEYSTYKLKIAFENRKFTTCMFIVSIYVSFSLRWGDPCTKHCVVGFHVLLLLFTALMFVLFLDLQWALYSRRLIKWSLFSSQCWCVYPFVGSLVNITFCLLKCCFFCSQWWYGHIFDGSLVNITFCLLTCCFFCSQWWYGHIFLPSDNCRLVDVRRPFWREAGFVVYNCC